MDMNNIINDVRFQIRFKDTVFAYIFFKSPKLAISLKLNVMDGKYKATEVCIRKINSSRSNSNRFNSISDSTINAINYTLNNLGFDIKRSLDHIRNASEYCRKGISRVCEF